MSLLEKASLIVTPNAYKESVLYSVVPNTTLGDMDVVRATTATRVNSAGLIEVVPRNLLTYSNDFTNAAWNKDYAIITPNATTSPDGTNNGTKLIGKNINDIQILYRTLTVPNGNTVFSFYVKKAEYSKAGIRLGGTANNATIAFDLDLNAIIYQAGSILSSQIIDLSNDWKRIILTVNITNEFAAPCVFGLPNSGYTWDAGNLPIYTGNGTSGIYIYGAQLEQGSTATEYFPTTDRLNIPRIDYTNGTCPSLLVEPQRTNLTLYSNNILTTYWTTAGQTITNNNLSPDGTLNASFFNADAGFIYRTYNSTPNATITISCYVKLDTAINFCIIANNSVAWNTIGGKSFTSADGLNTLTYTKISYTFTIPSSGQFNIHFGLHSQSNVTPQSNGTVYFYGAQLEIGSYPTSYIPTVASTVTRNADVISKTGISSLIGQTEGVIYFENIVNFKNLSSVVTLPLISNSSNSDYIILYVINDNIYADINIGFAYITTIELGSLSSLNLGSTYKLAIQYNSLGIKTYNNGVLIQTVSTVISNYSAIRTSSNTYLNNKAIILFKQYLTNAECIALTTL